MKYFIVPTFLCYGIFQTYLYNDDDEEEEEEEEEEMGPVMYQLFQLLLYFTDIVDWVVLC
jgi:hypothetical protein